MEAHPSLLILDLATVLGVAALTTLLCRRLRQPVVLGYLLAGLIVGPHVPIPLRADSGSLQTLAELGVVLLLFCVGLEFDFRKLAREGLPAVILGACQAGLTTGLAFLAGRALGWGAPESALMGAALAVSSTMIIAKLFEEHGGGAGPPRDLVLSVLVVQDLYAILLLAGLDTSAAGDAGTALARVALFLMAVLGVGGLLLPPLLRWAADHGRDETLLVAAVGACFTCAVLAHKAACSPALGAFAAGMLAAASRRGRPIERLVLPLRDLFGAVFFVAVGMLLEPGQMLRHAPAILVLTAVVVAGGALGGLLGAAAAGIPLPTGLRVGLTLAQPGELSFVLVGVGSATGRLWPHAQPVVVGVAFLASLLGPWAFRRGEGLARGLDRRLPAGLRSRVAALEGWTRVFGRSANRQRPLAGPLVYLALDALVFGVLLVALVQHRLPGLPRHPGAVLALQGAAFAVLAFLAGALYRRTGQIAGLLVGRESGPHLLRAALLFLVIAPAVAVVQPLLPRGPVLALSAGVLVCLGALVRGSGRSIPGSEWILRSVKSPWKAAEPDVPPVLETLGVPPGCPFAGRPLGDLDLALEAFPGTRILAVRRAGEWLPPSPALRVKPGDALGVSGAPASLERLERFLGPEGAREP